MDIRIRQAVREKKTLIFIYDNELREVNPHRYGLTTKHNEVIRGYEIGNPSLVHEERWKLFKIEKMANLKVTDSTFEPAPGYKPGDKQIPTIFEEV